MSREEAENIAKKFIDACNHSMWDGEGRIPTSFDCIHYFPYVGEGYVLYFEYQEDKNTGWYHRCTIYSPDDDGSPFTLCGKSINSYAAIADTAIRLVDAYLEEKKRIYEEELEGEFEL